MRALHVLGVTPPERPAPGGGSRKVWGCRGPVGGLSRPTQDTAILGMHRQGRVCAPPRMPPEGEAVSTPALGAQRPLDKGRHREPWQRTRSLWTSGLLIWEVGSMDQGTAWQGLHAL